MAAEPPAPSRPTAVICLDGCGPDYLEDALAHARVPALQRLRTQGLWLTGASELPSFTNPNNLSIVTGLPPAAHGISGNCFLDPSGHQAPMDERHLRAPTMLRLLAQRGVRVLAVTAKRKLLGLLDPGPGGLAFCAEAPPPEVVAWVGRPPGDIYSADASLWVLEAGVRAFEQRRCELAYLSTTDYVQHKHAPGTPQARAFLEGVDAQLGRLLELGVDLAVTADHGMNAKCRADGSPNVVYLAPLLEQAVGAGAQVVLPITDPYVVHHGALGSYALVYLLGRDPAKAAQALARAPGVEEVLGRDEAAARFELPADRLGELVVLAGADAVLGRDEASHDLSHVRQGLRSHGGRHEQQVPVLFSRAPAGPLPSPLRNRHVLRLALGAS